MIHGLYDTFPRDKPETVNVEVGRLWGPLLDSQTDW